MGVSALRATGCKEITVLADRGYFNGDQVLALRKDFGVLPCIPKTLTSSSAKRGLFTRRDFFYDAAKGSLHLPSRASTTRAASMIDRRDDIDHYRHLTACFTCSLKARVRPRS